MHKNVKVHFIGIGGASMSALAKFALSKGCVVTGSDREPSGAVDEIKKLCPVHIGENPNGIYGCDYVVFSSAIREDNAELEKARQLGIPVFERHQFLGEISRQFQRTVAVGGTHGKTTVTALITHALKKLGASFTSHIGGDTEFGNLVTMGDDLFVTEACEYKKSLLSLTPFVSVVLNAECDHPDVYPNLKSVLEVFCAFLTKGEVKVFSGDFFDICKSEHISIFENEKWHYGEMLGKMPEKDKDMVVALSNGTVTTFSYKNMRMDENGNHSQIDIYENGGFALTLTTPDNHLSTPINCLFSVAVLKSVGLNPKGDLFEDFVGVKRRNEVVGKIDGAKIVFDYAHHPRQIELILSSYKGKNLVVFQPHTYSRTKAYLDDFAVALEGADTLVIMETYGARECAVDGVDSGVLVDKISTKNAKTKVYHISSHQKTLDFVVSRAKDYDNVLLLGAGDVYHLKDKLLPYLD